MNLLSQYLGSLQLKIQLMSRPQAPHFGCALFSCPRLEIAKVTLSFDIAIWRSLKTFVRLPEAAIA